MKVALDARLVQPGEYFVPVQGENFDGRDFIDNALENGAAGVIEEEELYELASEKLERVSPTVIAVTGSVGKTTMCSFITTVLSTEYSVCQGFLNTKLGLAANIVNEMQKGDELFVAETGMDRPGELLKTGRFIKPQVVVITNISETHMEKLGSLEAIRDAKAEILWVLPKDGIAFLNWESEPVREIAHLAPHVTAYGLEDGEYGCGILPQDLPVVGCHNKLNAVGAYAVGKYFRLSENELKDGLSRLTSPKGRLNVLEGINKTIIIDDTYNSSPVSAGYALEFVAQYHSNAGLSGRKIAILGGMLELGGFEDEGHRIVGEKVTKLEFNDVVLVGQLALKFKVGLQCPKLQTYEVEDAERAAEIVKTQLKPQADDVILVKASQGVRLEKTVELLLANPLEAMELLVRQDARWK